MWKDHDLTRKELDTLISTKLLGMVACTGHRAVWYKDQGAALIKNCGHLDNTCYSLVELNTMLGRMGGPPQYCGSSRAGLILLRELEKRADVVVLHCSRGSGWSAELHSTANGTTSPIRTYGPCRAAAPEMAIALVAAELAGVKLMAEEITD